MTQQLQQQLAQMRREMTAQKAFREEMKQFCRTAQKKDDEDTDDGEKGDEDGTLFVLVVFVVRVVCAFPAVVAASGVVGVLVVCAVLVVLFPKRGSQSITSLNRKNAKRLWRMLTASRIRSRLLSCRQQTAGSWGLRCPVSLPVPF